MDELKDVDHTLVERAKGGSQDALTRLLYLAGSRYERHMQARIPDNLRSLISAEDIIQIAMASALDEIESFRSDSLGAFMLWFKRIAENSLQSEVRALRAKKRGGAKKGAASNPPLDACESPTKDGLPGEKLEREEVLVAVRMNLDDLPTTQRNAIRLHHLESKSISETAETLGKSRGKVRGIIERAKKKMKSAMGNTSKWFST